MMAAWMFYSMLCAVGLSVAAMLAERTLIAGRGPVRLVWIGAVALSLLLPAAAFRFARRPLPPVADAAVVQNVPSDRTHETTPAPVLPITNTVHTSIGPRDWRITLARYDEPLAIAWITLSLALAVNFLGGIVALVWMRRSWKRRYVQGMPVYVSARTGPAVVGAVSPAIVIPEWVLGLEPSQLALMLRHEEEHRRAGDGRLLTVAELALIAMPWNIALWWQIVRLRAAVELDCDARVLQHADARSYGDLLLEMARPRRVLQLSGATAFAERATQLERRIRVLGRHRVRTSRAARALATSIGLAAVTVAWVAPRPLAPARVSAAPAPQALAPAPTQTALPEPVVPSTSSAKQPNAAPSDSKTSNTAPSQPKPKVVNIPAAASALVRDIARVVAPPAPCGTTVGNEIAEAIDPIYDWLFAGISLTPERQGRACELLGRLQQEQMVADNIRSLALQANQEKAAALNAQRNSALRALLTDDALRATIDERAAQEGQSRGGRGAPAGAGARGAGGAADVTSQRGGRGGGGGGGVARSGGAGDAAGGARGGGAGARSGGSGELSAELQQRMLEMMTAMTFQRLFNEMALTETQATEARALIRKTQQEIQAMQPRTPVPVRLRFNRRSGVVSMDAGSAAALLALVANEEERATLESRIMIAQQ